MTIKNGDVLIADLDVENQKIKFTLKEVEQEQASNA
jgi:hypothetical protein